MTSGCVGGKFCEEYIHITGKVFIEHVPYSGLFHRKKLSQSSHFCCNSWKLYPQKSTWNQFWILQHPRISHVMCINYSTFKNILYHNLQIVHMHTRCHLRTMHMHTRCHLRTMHTHTRCHVQISREPT